MTTKLKRIALLFSIAFFILSLTQPAFTTSREYSYGTANSLEVLLSGWLGVLVGGVGVSWLANPFVIVSWFFIFKRIRTTIILSLMAMIFSASFLFFHTIMTDEAGNYSVIATRKAGYWLWLISVSIFAIFSVIIYFIEKSIKEREKIMVKEKQL